MFGLVGFVFGFAFGFIFGVLVFIGFFVFREGYNNFFILSENLIGLSRVRRFYNVIFVNFEDDEVFV